MKHTLFLLCLLASLSLQAQVNNDVYFFDPAKDPVALRSDTTLQLLVSEYVLAKSVKARLGDGCTVSKSYKSQTKDGAEMLVFEGVYQAKGLQRFTLGIPLLPDASGRFYHASAQALICSSPGCNNCSILQGNCVGCCSEATSSSLSFPAPLSKVQTNLEE